MSNDQPGIGREGLNSAIIDSVPGDIAVGNTGKPRNLGWDRPAGLLQLAEGIEHTVDTPAVAILEFDGAKLNDLVTFRVKAGCLDIKYHAD